MVFRFRLLPVPYPLLSTYCTGYDICNSVIVCGALGFNTRLILKTPASIGEPVSSRTFELDPRLQLETQFVFETRLP